MVNITTTIPVAHGGRIAHDDNRIPDGGWSAFPVVNTIQTDTFAGWFTTASGSGHLFVFDATTGSQVLNTMTLFARFTTNQTNLTVNLSPFALPPAVTLDPSTNATSIDVSEFEFGANISNTRTFTIDNAAAANLTNFTWTYNGVNVTTLTGAFTLSTANGVANSELEIDFGYTNMGNHNQVGTHVMTLQATGPGGAPWSTFITVTITNN
jgi:hypothetical protein